MRKGADLYDNKVMVCYCVFQNQKSQKEKSVEFFNSLTGTYQTSNDVCTTY